MWRRRVLQAEGVSCLHGAVHSSSSTANCEESIGSIDWAINAWIFAVCQQLPGTKKASGLDM